MTDDATAHDGDAVPVPPGAGALRVVRIVVLLLPRGRARDRYRDEFVAELWSVPPPRRARHLSGLLLSVAPLALTVRRAQRSHWRDVVGPRPARPLLCLLNLRHRWVTMSTEDGHRFTACARCSKEYPVRDGRDKDRHNGFTGWLGS